MLGVHSKNMLLEDGSLDTHEEAIYLKKFVGLHPFVLVTSEISRMYNLSRWGDDNYVDIVFEPNPYIDSLTCNGRFGNPSIHDFKEMILGVFNYDPAPPVTR